ncbi:MAG: FG-GAP-like repeat-containing protein [Myxococcota bacterium]
MARPCLLIALVAACNVDNELTGKNTDPSFDTGEPVTFPTDDTDTTPPVDEECNGEDDNGDGTVDEGFPDDDGNGRADCMDNECPPLNVGSEGSVEITEECQGTTDGGGGGSEVVDPWSVKTKWTFRAPSTDSSATNSYVQPVIGNLDDDNGDGVIDESDSPEVVINAFASRGYIVAIDGATGTEKWVWSGSSPYAAAVIADVDSDGLPDVVAYKQGSYPIALEGDGSLKWEASVAPTQTTYPLISVADLDADGAPEIIADDLVLNGEDGSLEFDLNVGSDGPYRIAAVADADLDGDQEIFMNGAAYDSDGSLLWTTGERGSYGFWPVVVQADGDDEAEIGFVGQNWTLVEDDGTEIYSVSWGRTAQPGPPCAADFDGDGETEVAWPGYQTLVMYELDGTPVWSVNMDDTSGLAGCSGWDVNNDGALEILFADQTTFTIFDGATGAELYVDSGHRSGTVFEYPTVADLDADGHAEILFTSNYGAAWGVLKAIEHDGDGWPAAGSTWAIHDFAITNVEPDGNVPAAPEPYWTKYNVYRARVAADDPSSPDLIASILEVCVSDCTEYGEVAVSVQVANKGGLDVDAGATLALYADERTERRLVATTTLPAVPAGTKIEGVEFALTTADLGTYGFVAVIDDDGNGTGAVNECDETNNEDDLDEVWCP